jgi:hypothetical protein
MNDLALAEWQAGWKPSTAKYILAEKEWQRRLSIRQLQEQYRLDSKLSAATNRAMQFAAILGVLGTLAGAGLGAYATFKASNSSAANVAPTLGNAAAAQAKPTAPTAATVAK